MANPPAPSSTSPRTAAPISTPGFGPDFFLPFFLRGRSSSSSYRRRRGRSSSSTTTSVLTAGRREGGAAADRTGADFGGGAGRFGPGRDGGASSRSSASASAAGMVIRVPHLGHLT